MGSGSRVRARRSGCQPRLLRPPTQMVRRRDRKKASKAASAAEPRRHASMQNVCRRVLTA